MKAIDVATERKLDANSFVAALTIIVYAGPILLDLGTAGWHRVFSYFAGDAYYYLTVARNFARLGYFTFDQQYLTNGFHPLWQVFLGILYVQFGLIHLADSPALVAVVLVQITLISAGLLIVAMVMRDASGRIPQVFPFIPVGIYALLVAPVHARYGTLWAFTNGMESAFVILFYAILLLLMSNENFGKTTRMTTLTSATLSLLFLSRLDHGILVASVVCLLYLKAVLSEDRQLMKAAVTIGAVNGAVLAVYMGYNFVTVGTLIPISAIDKSLFPRTDFGNFTTLISLIKDTSQPYFSELYWRFAQLAVPMIVSAGYIAYTISKRNIRYLDGRSLAFLATAMFVLVLGLYNLLYVPMFSQGHWYFPVSILFCSLVLISIIESHEFKFAPKIPLIALVSAFASLGFFITVYRDENYNQVFYGVYEEAGRLRQAYSGQQPKLLEFDDGIEAYSTGFPTMSGLGFMLDRQGFAYKREHKLLSLAFTRGYDLIASRYYFDASGLTMDTPSSVLQERLGHEFYLSPEEVKPFSFKVDYVSQSGDFVIIRITANH